MAQVLVVGSAATGSLEGYYVRALSSIPSIKVHSFAANASGRKSPRASIIQRALDRVRSELRAKRANGEILRYLAGLRDRFEAIIVFKGAEFSRQTLERARALQRRAIWVNINPDDPFNIGCKGSTNSRILASMNFFDVYCTWSRLLVSRLAESGCRRVLYLPFGYDPIAHAKPDERSRSDDRIISFCGAWDRQREALLTELACFDLRIYGDSWSRLSRRSPLAEKVTPVNIYGAELARVVNRSVAALNLLRPQNVGSHNMRTFEIPAMGGVMLTRRSVDQQVWFPEGVASLMFADLAELKAKMVLVTSAPDVYDGLRRQGEERLRGHSYDDRASVLINYLCLADSGAL